MTNKQYLYN